MNLLRHLRLALNDARRRLVRYILAHRIRYYNPTLDADPTALWDYGYHDLDALKLGEHVQVLSFAEIVVQKRSPRSPIPGQLILGDRAVIAGWVSIRAAGGTIRLGADSGIGQHSTVVAANHVMAVGNTFLSAPWDAERTGVEVGDNVWVGANCVLLPGCRIGDNSVIAAGSVVRGVVPANEVWGGIPAKRLRSMDGSTSVPGDGLAPSPT